MFFFFQAEDGIRDYKVTGVQTCALPISLVEVARTRPEPIGARAITRSIHPMAPDTLAEINLLAFFDHLGVRLGRVGPLNKSGRQPAIGFYIAGRPQNGDAGPHSDGDRRDGDHESFSRPFEEITVHCSIPLSW